MEEAAMQRMQETEQDAPAGGKAAGPEAPWERWLYVAGELPRSLAARANLRRICREHAPGPCKVVVIDLHRNLLLAQSDHIPAVPTLVRRMPEPVRRVTADRSNTERVLVRLDLPPVR